MDASLKTLTAMAEELGATTTILRERDVGNDRTVTEVLVRKVFFFSQDFSFTIRPCFRKSSY